MLRVSAQKEAPKTDTLHIGGVMIIRDESDTIVYEEKKPIFKKLNSKIRPRSVKTEWMILDIGISNYDDQTDYNSQTAKNYGGNEINDEWMRIKPFRSRNVNLWFVMQQLNLIRYAVNFKYAFGLEMNNYHYRHPIRYNAIKETVSNPQVLHLDETPGRTYSKNKLAADYLTVPLMLNFNFTPRSLYSLDFSAGISVGYLYSSRNKTITSDEGKKKERGDFDLRPWKLSYVAEANLGFATFYGSYAFKSMYQRGLDITPYNVGLRIRPMNFFNKLNTK
jgi:hypothetical protein